MAKASKINEMSFEQALGELEEIVARLESGEATLEDAIAVYERGSLLKKHCETKLNEAKSKVDKINFTPEGDVADAS